jgi:hypothetical protein
MEISHRPVNSITQTLANSGKGDARLSAYPNLTRLSKPSRVLYKILWKISGQRVAFNNAPAPADFGLGHSPNCSGDRLTRD